MAGLRAAPLLALAAAFFVGIALPERPVPGAAWAALAAALLVGMCVRFGRERTGTLLLLLAAFAAGAASRPTPASEGPLAGVLRELGGERLRRPVRLEGRLVRSPSEYADRTELRLRVESVSANRRRWDAPGLAGVRVEGDGREALHRLARGSRIEVWTRASLPRPSSNPGGRDASGPLGAFGGTKSALLVREIDPASPFFRLIRRLRLAVRERWERSGLEPEAVAVMVAILIGDRALADGGVIRSFRDAGTLHVMAVSGLHVGVVSLMLYGLLAFFGVRRSAALAWVLAALPIYVALSGGSPSVLRAALMAAAVILAIRLGIAGSALNGIGLAGLLLLGWNPWNALDVGFQLSFAATLAIVAVLGRRDRAAESWDPGRVRAWALGLVAVTLAAQLGAFPVLAWRFHRVVLAAIPVSVPATLLAGPILATGFGWLALGGVPLVGPLLLASAGWSAGALVAISERGASLPLATSGIPAPGWDFLAAWLVLAVAVVFVRGRLRWLPGLALAGLAVLLLPRAAPPDGTLRATALDVGMGDAVVLGLPAGGTLVVDAGAAFGGYSAGERVVVPFLLAAGGFPIRAAVATHGDLDHIGGFSGLFREFAPEAFWAGAALEADDRAAVRFLRRDLERRGVPTRLLRTGERFAFGGASFHVLFADPPAALEGANEGSLVLMVEYAGVKLLLTGDAGEPTERLLLERYGDELRADVLKVGHHGSRSSTSPAFLDAVAPRFALVSTREDPRRRLPAPSVLERLERAGVQTFRTDRAGAIEVLVGSDGSLDVRGYR